MLDSEDKEMLVGLVLDTLIKDFNAEMVLRTDIRNIVQWLTTLPVESLLDYIPCDHPVIQGRGRPMVFNVFDLPDLDMDQEYIDTSPMFLAN